ncbi:uncharacterized protein N0V89_010306 [Didymosphaeria variabile]|uniref:2-hydroxyacid dehydrogenase n=1 Tax=Didymosphaeria variabile TaxID=1932322 RepID=A0A9W8XBW8_9PLEO|nr:uncharacterized protein N0V89_010306 [Didymosphaeria variabile]KAJ4346377.1 hypothetical protein N0V89_010306 [Didymosphaeria variabile]
MPVRQPHIVCLGTPKYAGPSYITTFSQSFTYSVLTASNRAETISQIPKLIAEKGPIDGFVIRMGTPPYEPFDEELLSGLVPDCKIITSASAGYNEFDVEWMTKRGIVFCNSVDAVAEATADMAVWLLLSVLRNTSNAERSARAGKWRGGLVPVRDPTGLTLGIVGMGAIGKYLAKKAAVFNLKVAYHNRNRLPEGEEKAYNATYCSSLHGLLSASDVVSINCPLNAKTENLISTAEFAAMKDGAFLINTARGAIVDEAALKDALTSGKIARAGLDVLCNEPNVDPWFFEQDNVIVQPHLGGLTDIAFQKAERECFENIRAFFEKGKANSPVNADEVRR